MVLIHTISKGGIIMKDISYYPILKWRKGEQCALKELTINTTNFIPIIEIVDEMTPDNFFCTLRECYNGPVYIDTLKCDDSREILNSFIDYAVDNDIDVSPLLYPDDIFEFYEDFAKRVSNIAVKIPIPEDFEGISNDDIISHIFETNQDCLIDLILDAGEVITKNNVNNAFSAYKTQLNKIDINSEIYNKIIICLTSFPEKLDVDAGETASFKRYDFKIFGKLMEIYNDEKLAYSDYGVTKFTESEMDFSMMQYGVLPKIKYTTENVYYVLKGKKDHIRKVFTRSYIDMAQEIVNSNYYSGRDFSYGDAAIYEKATSHKPKPGGSTQWVTYCASHHLTFVMKQLSNLGGI